MNRIAPFLFAAAVTTFAPLAAATPRPLPFTYTYDTLGEGELEIEQYADYTPIKANDIGSGATVWYGATTFQTEFEYGITNSLELGLYVSFIPTSESYEYVPQNSFLEANGIKQRLKYRLAEEGEWPIDVALYGELVENDHEFEIEGKIILQRRIQKLRIAANLWAEREIYFAADPMTHKTQQDWVLNPTIGATYEITPTFHPGVEAWSHTEFPNSNPHPRPYDLGPMVYVGPAMLFNFGKFWWSTGGYVRATTTSHTQELGDVFGNFWIRTVVGVEL